MPAPVDTNYFDPAQATEGDEKLVDAWAGKIVVGTVANINPIKGVEVLIKAAAELKDRSILQFVIVGPVHNNQQKYYEKLNTLCRQLGVTNFDYIGPRVDVRSLLSRMDIYVCSSHAEASFICLGSNVDGGSLLCPRTLAMFLCTYRITTMVTWLTLMIINLWPTLSSYCLLIVVLGLSLVVKVGLQQKPNWMFPILPFVIITHIIKF